MEASKEFFTEIVVMLQTSNMKGYLQLLKNVKILNYKEVLCLNVIGSILLRCVH